MRKELVKIANKLDSLGFQREADVIDTFIRDTLNETGIDYTYNWNVNWKSEPVMKTAMHDGSEFSDDEEDENPEDVLYSGGTGLEIEEFSPHRHGESYEMDEYEILSDIDEDRELEKKYPAIHHFRRSSSDKRLK